MLIRTLTKKERESVYYDRILTDVPPNEIKTFPYLESLLLQGVYRCLGLFDGARLMGYAYFSCLPDEQIEILDFFAVCAENRDIGVGGVFLRLLTDMERGVHVPVGEVEDPDYAEGEEKKTRVRRIAFYERNGWHDTGVRCVLGHFITRIFSPESPPADGVRDALRKIYLATYGEDWLKNKIRIL